MPALGAPELIIILVIIVLIFGVGKLPEVGQALGKGIREFRGAQEDDEKKADEAVKPAAMTEPAPAPAIPAPPAQAGAGVQTAPTQQTAPAQQATDAAYTVQSGDTLESVAQRHGITIEALMQANGYSQRDRQLYPGDRLQLPRSSSAA